MPEPIDILENRLLEEDPELLRILLQDRTTGQPILWATDSYSELGEGYHWHDPIRPDAITGEYGTLIMPRVAKSTEEQRRRSKQMAEVFTPSWLVNQMCNALDEEWFGRPNVFNTPLPDHTWQPPEGLIRMPEGQTWVDYVLSPRLEITCGEAPFLVSRYDTVTGDVIPLSHRIGLLDRKLRIVGEQCPEEEWTRWALLALGSIYGYEWQGDNLLIAREALLATFSDYYEAYHHHAPSRELRLEAAEIISWNLWQMDGLKGVVPDSCHEVKEQNFQSLFGDEPTDQSTTPCPGCEKGELLLHNGQRCQLRRWIPSEEALPTPLDFLYTELITRKYKIHQNKRILMKFDYIIGNPPYQEETDSDSSRKPPIYNYFMNGAHAVSAKSVLITPARFLFNTGYTPRAWNRKMLEDVHFKILEYYPNGNKVFANTDIKGGVVISYYNKDERYSPIDIFTRYDKLNHILHKVKEAEGDSLSNIIFPPLSYDVTDLMKSEHPTLVDRLRTSAFEKLSPIFHKTKPTDKHEYIQLHGLLNGNRTTRFVRKDYISDKLDTLYHWKVLLPESNGSGKLGEVLSSPFIAGPGSGYTQTFLSIGAFETEEEAIATLKYIKTKFVRALLGALKITQHNPAKTWKYVPLQDFTAGSDIDWAQDVHEIDLQLYRKYGLTADEQEFIESQVKEMR